MISGLRNYMDSLDNDVIINRKLIFFEIMAAILGGIVIGFLVSPKKYIKIGNNNGNGKEEEKAEHAA